MNKPNSRKLVSALAVRNRGSRLYGKPMQNLCIDSKTTILDNVISCIKTEDCISEIILGIAEGNDSKVFSDYAEDLKIPFIVGNEEDVLLRLIQCGELSEATDIFRITSESPFPSYSFIKKVWQNHLETDSDATFFDDVIDGCGFEIIKLSALQKSHKLGEDRHRSELCTLFIRENINLFKVSKITPPSHLIRHDLRLTVDNPEDLVLCKAVYKHFSNLAPRIPIDKIINFLDQNTDLIKLTLPFTSEGYDSMYNWSDNEQ